MVGNIAEDLTDVIAEQEALIEELTEVLESKANVEDLTAIIEEQEDLIVELKELLESKSNLKDSIKVIAPGAGTPIPENEVVEKLYFNTNMSTDEVVSLVKSFMAEGTDWFEI
jgi:hypothetical protein